MIRINLLPGGASTRRAAPRSARASAGLALRLPGDPRLAGLAGAGVLFLVLAALGWWRTGSARTQLQADVEREAADSVRLTRTISLMQEVEARRDTIERKIEVIRAVDGQRYVWPHLMDEVSRAVPQYTWLTKLTAEEDEEAPPARPTPARPDSAAADSAAPVVPVVPQGPRFTLEGNTGSPQALTRLMKNLEASPMIREVGLVTSEQVTAEGRTFLKFTLEARYERPDSALIETVPLIAR